MKGEDGFKFASQLTLQCGDIWLSELAQYNHKGGKEWGAEGKTDRQQYEGSASESNGFRAEKCMDVHRPSLQKEICSACISIFNLMKSISDVYTHPIMLCWKQ